jgi:starch phosphorylase
MKAALNGGLNLSILDGWWDEWYDGNNGWAIPSADGIADEHVRDDIEATALYDLIEHEVAPRFYDRDERGLPRRWIEMVRHTLKSLGPRVLSTRMVRDYVERLYTPAAGAARAIAVPNGLGNFDGARALADFKARIRAGWDQVRIDHIDTEGLSESPEVGASLHLKAFVSLGSLSPDDVEVEVAHGRIRGEDQLLTVSVDELVLTESYEDGRHRFEGQLVLDHPGPFGYTVRVLPRHPGLATPAELGLVALP